MLSRRTFGGLVGAAACVGAAVASSAPAPALDLDAILLAEHEVAMRLAIAAAKAARQLGITEIPVMVAAGWSEAQKRAYGGEHPGGSSASPRSR